MSDHAIYVALAYATAFLTIGAVAARILLDYRRLKAELSRFGAKGQRETDQGEKGGVA